MAEITANVRVTQPYFVASATLDANDSMTLESTKVGEFDAVSVNGIYHDNDINIASAVDANDDGTYDQEVTWASETGSGLLVRSDNQMVSTGVKLEITDTSGTSDNDVIVTGELE